MNGVQASKARTHVDVSLAAQFLEDLFHSRVLVQGLNEGSDGIEGGKVHLLFQISKVPRGEAAVNPLLVVFESKFGMPHQEIAWAEAMERAEPCSRG